LVNVRAGAARQLGLATGKELDAEPRAAASLKIRQLQFLLRRATD